MFFPLAALTFMRNMVCCQVASGIAPSPNTSRKTEEDIAAAAACGRVGAARGASGDANSALRLARPMRVTRRVNGRGDRSIGGEEVDRMTRGTFRRTDGTPNCTE